MPLRHSEDDDDNDDELSLLRCIKIFTVFVIVEKFVTRKERINLSKIVM